MFEFLEEFGGGEEQCREIFSTGLMTECLGQMGFTGPGRTEEEDIFSAFDELTGRQLANEERIGGRIGGKVEGFESLFLPHTGSGEELFDFSLIAFFDFVLQDKGEKIRESELILLTLHDSEIEGIEDAGELECSELRFELGMNRHKRPPSGFSYS